MRTLKKTIVIVITAALLLSLAGITTVFAEDGDTGMDGDFDWVETGEDAVKITAYTGGGGSVTIPATLSGKTVTGIDTAAFKDKEEGDEEGVVEHAADITDITIQAPIKLIDTGLFSGCTKLESVTFEALSITEIGDNAFSGTRLTSIKVPVGTTTIGIEGLSMLTTIGDGAFSGTKLTGVRIPAGVTSIGNNAFSGCTDLTSLTFASENHLVSIGNNAFEGTKLVSISLPDSIESIGEYAFKGCTALTKVYIDNAETEVGTGAFDFKDWLTVYAPSGSKVDEFCTITASPHIHFTPLETTVGDTSITSVVSSGSSRITISWSEADRATEYEVCRASTQGGSYSPIATTAERSFTDTGLIVSTTYYYKVRGLSDSEGTYSGNYSAPVAATPMPGAPNSVFATSLGYNSINVSWTPVPSASGYEIWRANDTIDSTYSLVKTLARSTSIAKVTPNAYKFTSLTSGRKYFYKIRAYVNVTNPAGGAPTKCYGAYSGATMARPIPAAVTNLKAVQTGLKVIKLTWSSVAGRTRYEIWRKGPNDTDFVYYSSTSSTSYTNDRYIDADREYSYQVRAYRSSTTYGDIGSNGKIYGPISAIATVNLEDNLVTGVVAKRYNNSRINITWSGISGVAGYELQWAESADAPDEDWTTVDRKTYRYYYHTGRTDNTTYYYRVRAYEKVTGSSEILYGVWSEIKSAKT